MFAPNEDQWRKDCKKAAEVIRKDGWVQKRSIGPNNEHCLMNAVQHATGYWIVSGQANRDRYNAVRERIKAKLGIRYPAVWNDAQDRTKEEVLDLLEDLAVEFA
jgi:hypothetical protein